MLYAVIAAGLGSRLRDEGITIPKPLVRLNGIPMIERLVNIMCSRTDCEGVKVMTTPEAVEVTDLLSSLPGAGRIETLTGTTAGSMHSFHRLAPLLADKDFCLTTVDTVFRPEEFDRFIEAFKLDEDADGYMGVTTWVHDEKPLYVATEANGEITGFFDNPPGQVGNIYISGGIYALRPDALGVLGDCMDAGHTRMRDFQRALIGAGLRLKAWPFEKIVDVDHISDIPLAEELTAGSEGYQ